MPWAGCSAGCLTIFLLVLAGLFFGARFAGQRIRDWSGQRDRWTAGFEAKGYRKIAGRFVHVRRDVAQPTLCTAPVVQFDANASADVAIAAITAEVRGHVAGELAFRGQFLVIGPSATIDKDLDVDAGFVHVLGKVKGRIKGRYKALSRAPLGFRLPVRATDVPAGRAPACP